MGVGLKSCKLLCGGVECKHENWKLNENNYLEGLNSSMIDAEIIASQRPSTVLIEEYKLVQVFKE